MKVVLRQLGPGMMQQMQSVCPDCHGDGEMINEKDRCKFCQGRKVTKETKNHEIQIDKGMRDSQKITLHGEGDQTVSLSLQSFVFSFFSLSKYVLIIYTAVVYFKILLAIMYRNLLKLLYL